MIDEDGDKHLQKEEVVQALLPGSKKNRELCTALGCGEDRLKRMLGLRSADSRRGSKESLARSSKESWAPDS